MRGPTRWTLLAAAVLVAFAGTVHAAGFNIYEAGARATALGGAFTATADDGSALFYNASGMSFVEGHAVDINLMPITPGFKFAEANDGQTNASVSTSFPIPGVYYTSNHGTIAWGIGVYAPYGLGIEWENRDTWVGRQASYDVSIETVYLTPAISWRVSESFAASIGVDVVKQSLDLNKMTLHPALGVNALNTSIEGHSDIAVTPTAGLMFRPNPVLSLGLMYHHSVTMKYTDGDAHITNIATPGSDAYYWGAALLAGLGGENHKIASELNLPSILSAGVSWQFIAKLRAEFNAVWFKWSEFQSLGMTFDNDPDSPLNQDIVFDYEDAWQFRLGLEWDIIENLAAMGGFVYDTTPQPLGAVSPILPDSDRQDYSIGLQYKVSQWELTVSYMYVNAEKRTNIENGQPVRFSETYPVGEYSSNANIVALGAGYRW